MGFIKYLMGIELPFNSITEKKLFEGSEKSSVKPYVKALPINNLSDVSQVKAEVGLGNIIIARITPLAKKSVEDAGRAVEELCSFVEEIGGDIARLGEERLVITPSSIRIWRKLGKTE